ncbi:MFS transporter [Pseudomonas sp. B2M1-30]|uniref:MFS transporter n=1 Tax=Pseudomonas TaxID=286 RepID=UPI0021C7D45D|nr:MULTISPECIES: MFS transporter [Pseudomonas]MCU0120291.1 MFS transporter [Pseudomonas sp. B2M1-30]MCU7260879.1 MFS transporter [Pseudomonas koreensis]
MIYFVRFLSSAAWSCFYPFMAIWLNTAVGLSTSAAGIVVGFAIVSNRIGALAFQGLLDRVDRRREIALALACVAVAALLMLLTAAMAITNVFIWVALVVVFGVANSVATISQISYIVQYFREGEHERVLSYENVAANAGAGVAPFVASLILAGAGYWFVALPLLLGVLATASTTLIPHVARSMGLASGGASTLDGVETSPKVIAFLAINFLTMIGYAQFYYVFPTYATERFSSELVGVLFLVASGIIIFTQVYVTALSQRVSRLWRVIVSNLLIGAGCLLLMISAQAQAILFVVVVFIVIGEMICGPLYQAQAVKIWRGRSSVAMAVQTCVWGAAEATAAVLGLLAVARELSFMSFLLGFTACVVAAVGAWVSIALKRPLIGIELEQRSPQVS